MGIFIIDNQYSEILQKFPKLVSLTHSEFGIEITGSIDVIDDNGGYWETYDVAIKLDKSYPKTLPLLIETSKKIERDWDWHISPSGVCCLSTPARMFSILGNDMSLIRWLTLFAYPYLANHVYRRETGHYANREYAHGIPGIIEGWKQIVKLDNDKQLLHYMKLVAGLEQLSLNQHCFCGSLKKYKRCYLIDPSSHMFLVPKNLIVSDIKVIDNFIKLK